MSLTSRVWILLLLTLAVVLTAGCGGSGPQSVASREQLDLKEIQEIYQLYVKNHQKAPSQLSDLTKRDYEGIYPGTVDALKKGRYVVVWGVNSKDSGTLLAYEKDVPTKGGGVVMADGTVKTMTADELKAAKKS